MNTQTVVYVLGGLFVFFVVRGIIKGGIGLVAGSAVFAVSLLLAGRFAPDAGSAILSAAPLEEIITSRCESFIVKNMQAETRKRIDDALGVDVENGCRKRGIDYAELGITREEMMDAINALDLSREEEVQEITGIDLPEKLRKLLMENNNEVIYERFGVTGFAEYLGAFLARIVANTVAFVLVFAVAAVGLKLLVGVFIERPVRRHLGGLNRCVGAFLGGLEAVLLIWVIFTVMALFDGTAAGSAVFEAAKKVSVLGFLRTHNPLLEAVWKVM